ncbi:FAD:protein FMN transferase [Marmoricola sp. URHB0036]|uniref:FAD:protein FMN transferase n=1 Tax=Marmoricola sp. URHB0036 TaxID=1298863 RepID=UPI00047F8197|nr:FAD:protein FMN transferase [Marmoricola sp. URHB0036]
MSTPTLASRDWELWSTSCRLVVTDPAALPSARALVDWLLAEIERACSRFRPDSELMTLARNHEGGAELSPLLADLMADALEAARETDGAVDPTLGSVLVGLGYDTDLEEVRRRESTKERPRVTVVRRAAGWRTLTLEGPHLQLPPGLQLDLGATAKAGAADRCARLVASCLETGVLVSLGGDIATAGPAPEGGWQVLVQDLPSDVPQQITLAAGAAVATSSSARRTWTQAGRPRHHLVDPRTGLPATGPWRSITVVAPTALKANTATTAAMVKGRDALAWLRGTGLPARLVPQHGGLVTLGGWPREAAA